ncbi:helicase, partial [Helicobacter pylori]
MQKKKAKNPQPTQPNLFSILDNGDIATNNPIEIQEPLPYVVKTQINKASMISR